MKGLSKTLRTLQTKDNLFSIMRRLQERINDRRTGIVPAPKKWAHAWNKSDYDFIEDKMPNGTVRLRAVPKGKIDNAQLGSDPNCW